MVGGLLVADLSSIGFSDYRRALLTLHFPIARVDGLYEPSINFFYGKSVNEVGPTSLLF